MWRGVSEDVEAGARSERGQFARPTLEVVHVSRLGRQVNVESGPSRAGLRRCCARESVVACRIELAEVSLDDLRDMGHDLDHGKPCTIGAHRAPHALLEIAAHPWCVVRELISVLDASEVAGECVRREQTYTFAARQDVIDCTRGSRRGRWVVNSKGHPESLVPAQPGNQNAIRHGLFSSRTMSPRAQELEDALMSASHTVELDRIAAAEIASLLVLAERMDADIERRGLLNKAGEPRTLIELRIRISGRIERWLSQFGATPASRVDWVGKLSAGSDLVATLRREMDRATNPESIASDGEGGADDSSHDQAGG